MANKGLEIIKDIITSILILVCIVVVLCIIFYDRISISKVIPETEDYILTQKMQEELKDTNLDDTQEVVVNYYIDASDLKKYEQTKEYDKGKSNPFAEVDISNTNNSNESSSTTNNTNTSGNFYEDDGTK